MRLRELYDSKIAKGGIAATILGLVASAFNFGIAILDWLGRKEEAQTLFRKLPRFVASPWFGPVIFMGGAVLLAVDFQARKNAAVGAGQKSKCKPPATESGETNPEPTLISLMDTSFPSFNKLWGKPSFQFSDGISVEIRSALYFDLFTSGAKFLGFGVPRSGHTLEVCGLLARHANELGEALSNGGLSITGKNLGENPQTLNDLSYSGKVYLFHEDTLTHKQMAEVEETFKAQKLDVVLRGPDFLTQACLKWKEKS